MNPILYHEEDWRLRRWEHGQRRSLFSCDDWVDPERLGFGPLRVMNLWELAPGSRERLRLPKGVKSVLYVLEGELQLKGRPLVAGERLICSAGEELELRVTGSEPCAFIELWGTREFQIILKSLSNRDTVNSDLDATGSLFGLWVLAGQLQVDGQELASGDLLLQDSPPCQIRSSEGMAEVLLIRDHLSFF